MSENAWSRRRLAVLALVAVAACAGPDRTRPPRFGGEADLWRRMLAAEDGRTASPAAIGVLAEGLESADLELRRWAVRALGRLEQPSLLPSILPLLADLSAEVRAEAADAVGQAVSRGAPAQGRAALVARLAEEIDPVVRGVIAETLGRLRHESADEVRATAGVLLAIAADVGPTPDTWLGIAKGLYFLVRQPVARGALPDRAAEQLRGLTVYEVIGADAEAALTVARVRRVATAALAGAARITAADIRALLGDADAQVRREAVVGITGLADRAGVPALVERARADSSPMVRLEAVRALSRRGDPGARCDALRSAIRDPDGHVALQAIDASGTACGGHAAVLLLLDSLVSILPDGGAANGGGWHPAAHALVSLALLEPARARAALPPFAAHPDPFVRAWAARAALPVQDTARLRGLAADSAANVRTLAVEGLRTLVGHEADPVFIAQLAGDDSQLLQAAAAALEGTADPTALPALLDALDRMSAARRETWRDSRVALLRRIGELGGVANADRVRPWLEDYDPQLAALAADVLGQWTGERPEPAPRPLPRLELPTLEQLEALETSEAVIEMEDGGRIRLRLLPWEAPTNAWRFARLARDGYYDGLTFHRVVPNFVIQGGSPGANEYAGDGPYTRDELGLTGNWRGTVGLSTRGRDTGDAQIYVNLIDNTRLDHDYTVFAEVVAGLDVIDRILEGAVIRTIRITGR